MPACVAIVARLSPARQAMNTPVLTLDEQRHIHNGAWFSKLSAPLRADILARAHVRRLADGEALATRGSAAEEWCGVARGAVRISTVSLQGKQVTLTYAEPGTWFGDIALFDGLPRTHDADAHGPTTLLTVGKADFRALLQRHVELYDALLRLNCRRLRLMFDSFEDLNTRPLQARLARQLLLLARSYGVASGPDQGEIRIGLALAQEDLAQLLGASRQRVNQELKGFEREGILRVEPTRLVVLARDKLMAAAER
jgi:CRP/FNR family transcriptional regulator, cyclic AMP receptor protein